MKHIYDILFHLFNGRKKNIYDILLEDVYNILLEEYWS